MADRAEVRLERLRADHASALFEVLADPALYRHLDEEPPPSLGWLQDRFAALERGAPPDLEETWLNWAIVAPDGALIGTTQATIRPGGPTWIAYVVGVAHQGRGLARAAVRSMLAELATAHDVEEVQAEIDPSNTRSIHLVESLGFTAEGAVGSDLRFARRLTR